MTSSAFDLSQFGSRVTSLIDPENRIINGAFDFWQRGTSSTSGGFVAADRWPQFLAGGTVTQSRQAFALGDALGNNNPTYFLRQTVSGQTLASHYATTLQKIENVRSYAGQTVTILGWARRSSGAGNMTVSMYQEFGTGGSPSSGIIGIGATIVTLTGSWAPFAVTIAVPSITGKTLGTNGNDALGVEFMSSAGSDFNARSNSLGLQTIGVDLWGIHIKLGSQTVDAVQYYRQPELGPELARCQRYYEVLPAWSDTRNTVNTANSYPFNTQLQFKVTKRSIPSMAVSLNITAFSSLVFADISVNGCIFGAQSGSTGASGTSYIYTFGFTASAEL